jgi:DNA-binding GntR family transcriptional regulator
MDGHFPLIAEEPIEDTSLVVSLTGALRTAILLGEIKPGSKLSEQAIADRFEVARATAKVGIDRLTAEGVLRRSARRSAVVPILSPDEISDLYFAREPVEAAAVRLLSERKSLPDAAWRALDAMRRASVTGDLSLHAEGDIALHQALIAGTRSVRLQRLHAVIIGETRLVIAQAHRDYPLDLGALTDLHAGILGAIAAGDADLALDALFRDLRQSRDLLIGSKERGRRPHTLPV